MNKLTKENPLKKSTNSTTEFTFPFGDGSSMRSLTITPESSVAVNTTVVDPTGNTAPSNVVLSGAAA